jgi:hypothetical protein
VIRRISDQPIRFPGEVVMTNVGRGIVVREPVYGIATYEVELNDGSRINRGIKDLYDVDQKR